MPCRLGYMKSHGCMAETMGYAKPTRNTKLIGSRNSQMKYRLDDNVNMALPRQVGIQDGAVSG